ncbi:MAG: tetratricopeptide repeat protein [Labilithrix sp.]|nr:tetratricopeptide repeat protein [Labilithrix sp.]MCW5834380.1 tetratricopeptide repeat protein [Labilithrix sp.]
MRPGSKPPLPPIRSFDALARAGDDEIDVAVGAALIAKDVYDDLDVDALLGRLDELAGPLHGGALAGRPLREQVDAVSARFRDLGFRGNVEDYYDAKNSLLPDVLERRVGIPITLTLVWCEIARRAGVHARGVGFPGHFLARVDHVDAPGGELALAPVIVDPFAGGRVVDDEDARALLERTLGAGAVLHPSLFAPATARATLVRMLTNLKAVWAGRGEHARAFIAIDRIALFEPDSARVLRERAGVALRLGIHALARTDLARVLELEPNAPDAPAIQERLATLRSRPAAAPN